MIDVIFAMRGKIKKMKKEMKKAKKEHDQEKELSREYKAKCKNLLQKKIRMFMQLLLIFKKHFWHQLEIVQFYANIKLNEQTNMSASVSSDDECE